MPNVDIPGVGVVAFPDSMKDTDINAAAKRLYSQAQPQSPIRYSGAPDLPLQETHPIEGAMMLASLPGLVRAIPGALSSGAEMASSAASQVMPMARRAPFVGGLVKGAEEAFSRLPSQVLVSKAARAAIPRLPGLQPLGADIGEAASRAVADIHPSDAGRALRAARDAKAAATIAQKEAAPAAEQTIARSLGDQGSSVEKFTAEVAPNAEKTAVGQAAKRTVKPGAKGAKGKPLPGSAESRIKLVPKAASEPQAPAQTDPGLQSRHDVQYYSQSRGQHVNIEDMNQKHIEQAFRKLAATNPKPGTVAARQLQALLDESIHRLQTTGIHIGQ